MITLFGILFEGNLLDIHSTYQLSDTIFHLTGTQNFGTNSLFCKTKKDSRILFIWGHLNTIRMFPKEEKTSSSTECNA